MVLEDRGSRARCLLVWATGTTTLACLACVALPAASEPWSSRRGLDLLPLDRALVDLAAAVLLGCTAWAWLALSSTVLEALRGLHDCRRGARRLPGGVRRVVLAACGVALASTSSPALAGASGHHRDDHDHLDHHGVALLSGLPLPERAALPARRPESRQSADPGRGVVVVQTGDSLWSIAARDLPTAASDGEIDARWHAIYAANHDLIGPDPDRVEPGQRLQLPPSLPRKDPR